MLQQAPENQNILIYAPFLVLWLRQKNFFSVANNSFTVLFQSIRQPLWRVTRLTKIWFRQVAEMSVTTTKFRQVVGFFFSKLVGGHLVVI